jgi:hypothetical protein
MTVPKRLESDVASGDAKSPIAAGLQNHLGRDAAEVLICPGASGDHHGKNGLRRRPAGQAFEQPNFR